jgi:molybdopterin synthase catalytic subunit
MRIRVLYFASLRQRLGFSQEALELDDSATVADLKQAVGRSHPELAEHLGTAIVAVNREFAFPEERLNESDEVALFPPVSGGGPPTILRVTDEPIDFNELLAALVSPTTGAICLFSGMVRGRSEGSPLAETERLEYEAYPEMALSKLQQVAEEIRSRWANVEGIAIVQRIGPLPAGTPTVIVACSAAHRDSGVFEAARYGIDRLKEIVPIWKKEVGPGGESWVEGKYTPVPGDRG